MNVINNLYFYPNEINNLSFTKDTINYYISVSSRIETFLLVLSSGKYKIYTYFGIPDCHFRRDRDQNDQNQIQDSSTKICHKNRFIPKFADDYDFRPLHCKPVWMWHTKPDIVPPVIISAQITDKCFAALHISLMDKIVTRENRMEAADYDRKLSTGIRWELKSSWNLLSGKSMTYQNGSATSFS